MVDWILNTKRCALHAGMGLGKTVATLTAIVDLFAACEITRVLIISPLKVALTVWPKEIENWEHTKWMSYTNITGPAIERALKLKTESCIHLINRELIPWLFDTLQTMRYMPYDMIVVDESSSFKSSTAHRTKALKKIAPVAKHFVELTATPASNSLIDLWSQIYLLDQGKSLESTIDKYKSKYFISDYMGYKLSVRGPEILSEITGKIKHMCLSLATEDYLAMPEKIEYVEEVSFTPELLKGYRTLEKEFLLDLEADKGKIIAFNAATKVGKLLQYCNGEVYITKDEAVSVHDLKLNRLLELIEAAEGQPVVVAYSYRSDRERILKALPQAVALDRKGSQIPAWNRGEIPILLAHPMSAGHGINLQYGGHIIIWYGICWSLELFIQFNGRIHRQGQTKPTQIYYILIKNSVDNVVHEALKEKDISQKELLLKLKHQVLEDLR